MLNFSKKIIAVFRPTTGGQTLFFLNRHVQEVKLDKNIKLLDSPGIVISKEGDAASLVLKNCVRVSLANVTNMRHSSNICLNFKIEQLADPVTPCDLIIKKVKRDNVNFY
jgi:ribosome biogenesis GTPase A